MSLQTPLQPRARMGGEELLSEVRWFLEADVHPLQICDQLGRKPATIYSAAWKAKDATVMAAFGGYQKVKTNPRRRITPEER